MKGLLVVPLLLVLTVGLIGYADAYEGDITFHPTVSKQYIIGDTVSYVGFLIEEEPEPGSIVTIRLFDHDGNLLDTIAAPVSSEKILFEGVEDAWQFDFEIDTGDYELVTFKHNVVTATFEEATDKTRLAVYPTPEQSRQNVADALAARGSNATTIEEFITSNRTAQDDDLSQEIEEKDRKIAELEATIIELEDVIVDLEDQIEELRSTMDFMHRQFAENIRLANEWFKSQLD